MELINNINCHTHRNSIINIIKPFCMLFILGQEDDKSYIYSIIKDVVYQIIHKMYKIIDMPRQISRRILLCGVSNINYLNL